MMLKIKLSIWFHDDASDNESILVAGSDGFHESSCSQRLLILQISQLRHVDVGGAGRKGS